MDRAAQALKRLGVNTQLLAASPQITPLLKNAQGGLKAVLGAMRFSSDETIKLFLEKYDSIPVGDRKRVSWEAIGIGAGINLQMLGWAAMTALGQHSANAARIIAMSSQPKITQARVKYGLLPSGEKDRTALEIANGLLPSPKGNTIINKQIFGSGAQTMTAQGAGKGSDDDDNIIDADDPDLDELFPPANTMQEKLVPIRQRLLEDGK